LIRAEVRSQHKFEGPRIPRGLARPLALALLIGCSQLPAGAQTAYTWEQIKTKFEETNPTLKAGQIGIAEFRAEETTAYLRPNPDLTLSTDGTQISPSQGIWTPTAGTTASPTFSYLHERQHKRELRLLSAQKATAIGISGQADLERNLLFSLRNAFVQTLQAKAVRDVTHENLDYYDHVLNISRDRFKAGDIAQIDLDRLELQRVQYESDLQAAEVNLRTAKIQLLMLMNDRTPVEKFNVTGPFDFTDQLSPLDRFRQIALDTRPDLKEAVQSVDKARTDHQLAVANGSTDPTLSAWWTYNPSFANPNAHETFGASVSIPLRIFDRNQGEKLRTQLDVTRTERLRDAAEAQVFNDVDSAYATLNSNVILLRPYKAKYLAQAGRVRETMSFAYQHGGAALIDYLSAQNDYRAIRLSYINLVGSYLTAANQLNLAVGREVIQ
jgi:outer membrane protein, heavy metal efflux system